MLLLWKAILFSCQSLATVIILKSFLDPSIFQSFPEPSVKSLPLSNQLFPMSLNTKFYHVNLNNLNLIDLFINCNKIREDFNTHLPTPKDEIWHEWLSIGKLTTHPPWRNNDIFLKKGVLDNDWIVNTVISH